jgi:hypothetical protein
MVGGSLRLLSTTKTGRHESGVKTPNTKHQIKSMVLKQHIDLLVDLL